LDVLVAGPVQQGRIQRVGVRRNSLRIADAVRVLPSCSVECQDVFTEYLSVLRCRLSPVFSDRPPGTAEPFFIGIPVLGNDPCHAVRVSHRQTETSGCAVVEDIQCTAPDFEGLNERVECRGQPVERVEILSFCGDFCESKSWQVRRDDTIIISQMWDEFGEHEGRCWEPVKQQNDRGIRVAGCPVEHVDSIRLDPVDRRNR